MELDRQVDYTADSHAEQTGFPLRTATTALRNGLWNGAGSIMLAVAGFAGSLLIVRGLTPSDYGLFSYYIWLAGLVQVMGTLGFPAALTKVAAELRGEDQLLETRRLAFSLVLALLGFNILICVCVILWAILGSPATRGYLLVVAVVQIFNVLSAMLGSTLWSYERFKPAAMIKMIAAPVQLALIGAAYTFSWGVSGYLLAALSLNVIIAPALLIVVYRFLAKDTAVWSRLPSPYTLWRYVTFVIPTSLLVLADTVVWQRSEVFFLNHLSTIEQVGFYSLAFTAYGIFLSLGWALVVGFFPTISHAYGAGDWPQIRQNIAQCIVLAAIYAVPLSFGAWVMLEGLVRLLYTDKMLPAVPPAMILFAGLISGTAAGVFGIVISALRYVWIHVGLGFLVMIVNIGLDIALIPVWGAVGGAIANTVSQMIYTLLLYLLLRRRCQLVLPWFTLTTIVVIGAVTTFLVPKIIITYIPGLVGLLLAVATSACCYVGVLWRFDYLRLLQPTPGVPRNV